MRRRKKIILVSIVVLIVALLIGGRIYLPYWVTDYVNKTIHNLKGYDGSVRDIDIHLWRGAYQIHDLNIVKESGAIPTPFVKAKTIDLAVDWRALFHGAIVAEIHLYDAELNFATSKGGREQQTGKEANWINFIDKLSPLDINRLLIHDGKVAYKDFSASPQVDVFIDNIRMEVLDLRNVDNENIALPSTLNLTGTSIGKGQLTLRGKMNILKNTPDFDMDMDFENISLPAINNYSRDRAAIDFVSGVLSVYAEVAAKDGRITGYVKPVVRNIEMVSSRQDNNPFNYIWESIASFFIEIFSNQPHDQFATRIEIEGTVDNPQTNIWSTIGGILSNAFVQAFSQSTDGTVDFSRTKEKKAAP